MNTLVYCIECGEMVHLEEGIVFGHLKYIPSYVFDFPEPIGVDIDLCEFPSGYAFVAPPAVDPDWIDSVVEPGEEVLEPELEVEPYFDLSLPEEYIAWVMYRKSKGLEV